MYETDLLEGEFLDPPLDPPVVLLVLHQPPLLVVQVALHLPDLLLQTLHDLAASLQGHLRMTIMSMRVIKVIKTDSYLFSLVELGLHVLHLVVEGAAVPLLGLGGDSTPS